MGRTQLRTGLSFFKTVYKIAGTYTTSEEVETVQRAGKPKVTKLKVTADIVHLLIRLPKTYADEIDQLLRLLQTDVAS